MGPQAPQAYKLLISPDLKAKQTVTLHLQVGPNGPKKDHNAKRRGCNSCHFVIKGPETTANNRQSAVSGGRLQAAVQHCPKKNANTTRPFKKALGLRAGA